jgi:hypothetical protein
MPCKVVEHTTPPLRVVVTNRLRAADCATRSDTK